ncbi:hypothetical protein D3C71_2105720 [compost metagenome]
MRDPVISMRSRVVGVASWARTAVEARPAVPATRARRIACPNGVVDEDMIDSLSLIGTTSKRSADPSTAFLKNPAV